MSTFLSADFSDLLDEALSIYLRGIGTSGSGYGIGDSGGTYGAAAAVQSLKTKISAIASTPANLARVNSIMRPALQLDREMNGAFLMAGYLTPLLSALQNDVAASGLSGVNDLDTYLSYYNTGGGGTWQALQAPAFVQLYKDWRGYTAGPKAWNVYFEVLQGGTYALGVGRGAITGPGACSFTIGETIDSSIYCGGFPFLNFSAATGAGLVTVTGSAFDPVTKSVITGSTWTYAIAGAAGNAALVPGGAQAAPANSLIVAVSNITVAAGLSTGTLYVEAHRPAGRPLLPL